MISKDRAGVAENRLRYFWTGYPDQSPFASPPAIPAETVRRVLKTGKAPTPEFRGIALSQMLKETLEKIPVVGKLKKATICNFAAVCISNCQSPIKT